MKTTKIQTIYFLELKSKICIQSGLLAILLLCPLLIFGQCDATLRPSDNQSLAYRIINNRCEGIYSAKVGAPDLDLVGLTIGNLTYSLDKTEIIKIENSTDLDLSIRSSAIPLRTYYRMDALMKKGTTLNWEVKDILLKLKIPSNLLALCGWVVLNNEKTYIPVRPLSSSTKELDKKLYLVIRPNSRVMSVNYRYALEGKTSSTYQGFNTYQEINRTFQSGQPIVLILPEDLKGNYLVEVAALLESGRGPIKKQFKIAIK